MIMIHQLEILGQFGIIPLINHDSRLRSPGFGRFYFASSDGSTHLRALTVARASLGQLHLTRSIVLSPLVGKITEKPPSIVLGCLGALGSQSFWDPPLYKMVQAPVALSQLEHLQPALVCSVPAIRGARSTKSQMLNVIGNILFGGIDWTQAFPCSSCAHFLVLASLRCQPLHSPSDTLHQLWPVIELVE